MAHLGLIQRLLNSDANYRKRFLQDPVAALAEQGLLLSPEMQASLRKAVAKVQAGNTRVAGAAFPLSTRLGTTNLIQYDFISYESGGQKVVAIPMFITY